LGQFQFLGLIGHFVGSILVLGFVGIMVFVCLKEEAMGRWRGFAR